MNWKPWMLMILFMNAGWLHGQNAEKKLNQQELIKQFIGKWKTEVPGDSSVLTVEIIPFGKALEGHVLLTKKGKTITAGKWIWGYYPDEDVILAAEITSVSPGIALFAYSFVSEKILEKFAFADISNTERESMANRFEFKSPDLVIQTLSHNNKIINTFTIQRVKDSN